MNNQYKLNAFTVIELIVGAILAAIAVVAAFSVIQIINTQYEDHNKDGEYAIKLGQFSTSLKRDFEEASKVEANPDEIRLTFPNHKTSYIFTVGLIERIVWQQQEEYKQKFELDFVDMAAYFQNTPKKYGFIDALTIQIRESQKMIILNLRKQYSSKDLFDMDYGNRH